MTHEEYLKAGAILPEPEPTVFSGKPKPRQVCECSNCGRVAIVVCGKCDEVKT